MKENTVSPITNDEWKEMPHPYWGKGGIEERVFDVIEDKNMFPRTIWRKGKYSIIPPCGITFDKWEMFDGTHATRYATLEEAQQAANGDQ